MIKDTISKTCIDPAESAQIMRLMYLNRPEFSGG